MKRRMTLPALLLTLVAGPALAICTANEVQHGREHSSEHKDIVDTAVSAKKFDTLVKAVKAADLVDVLKSDGPFTVFAPTDEAFAQIPDDKLQALLNDKQALRDVLTYHVVSGKVMAEEVVEIDSAKTVLGKPLKITVENGTVFVNDAKVVKTDILCSNGVIHVIDGVLLPPAE